jgi:hypothetical protein
MDKIAMVMQIATMTDRWLLETHWNPVTARIVHPCWVIVKHRMVESIGI